MRVGLAREVLGGAAKRSQGAAGVEWGRGGAEAGAGGNWQRLHQSSRVFPGAHRARVEDALELELRELALVDDGRRERVEERVGARRELDGAVLSRHVERASQTQENCRVLRVWKGHSRVRCRTSIRPRMKAWRRRKLLALGKRPRRFRRGAPRPCHRGPCSCARVTAILREDSSTERGASWAVAED